MTVTFGANPGGPPSGFGGPGGGFGGGPPGGMMRGMDPERLWEILKQQTGSTDETIDLSKLPESVRRMNRMMAERFGTEPLPESGIMTKEQFISFSQRNLERMQSGMMGGGPGAGFGGGPPAWGNRGGDNGGGERGNGWGGFGGGPPWTGGPGWGGSGWGGGPNWAGGPGWGGPGWGGGPPWSGPDASAQDPRNRNRDGRAPAEEAKPVALRYGKLPGGLPDWFESDDTNKDGQISLYEWMKAGKSLEEFMDMDLDRDGLLTADELLRYRRLKDEEARIAAIMEGTPRPSMASNGGNLGRGGRGGGPGGTNNSSSTGPTMIRLPGSSADDSSSNNSGNSRGETNDRGGGNRNNPFQNGGRR